MVKIFASCDEIDLTDKLCDYLTSIEDKYEEILNYKNKYQNFKDGLNDWFIKYQKELQDSKHNKEMDRLKHELEQEKSIKDNNDKIFTELLDETIKYKNIHNDFEYSPEDIIIKESFNNKLNEIINFNKNKYNYIKNKYEQKVKDFIYSYNVTEDDSLLLLNYPKIKIIFNRNIETTIKYSDLEAYFVLNGVQKTVCKQIARMLKPDADIGDNTNIPYIAFI